MLGSEIFPALSCAVSLTVYVPSLSEGDILDVPRVIFVHPASVVLTV